MQFREEKTWLEKKKDAMRKKYCLMTGKRYEIWTFGRDERLANNEIWFVTTQQDEFGCLTHRKMHHYIGEDAEGRGGFTEMLNEFMKGDDGNTKTYLWAPLKKIYKSNAR